MGKYKFNKADMPRFTAERRHAEGVFARIITDAEPHESENNDHVMGRITSKALADPDDPSSVVPYTDLLNWVILPLDNPDVDGHTAPDYAARMWAEYCSAVFSDECTAPPRRIEFDPDKQKMTGPLYFDGEPIEDEDRKTCEAAAILSCGEKAEEVAEDWSILVGRGYFCAVRGEIDGNGVRMCQKAYRAELPDHWTLAKEYVVTEAVNAPAEAKTAKGKKAPSKKASKRRRK